ncbi:MAG: hypothetical protein FJX72_07525, partial [Armatimonadetes bacterium]|nr:hypothetical protein [Armatimonadota bacterium]
MNATGSNSRDGMTRRDLILRSTALALPMTGQTEGEVRYGPPTPLPADPFDAVRLENDVLGVRVWGPASQPTISIGRADIWDRRWFEDRQPLITAARIRELAFADRLSDVTTAYDLYGRYDFPCPKPGVQASLRLPFGERAIVERGSDSSVRLTVTAPGRRLVATIGVALGRPIVFVEVATEGDGTEALAVRISRHSDTILPGQPLDPTLGDATSPLDFEPLPPPRSWAEADRWGVMQTFPEEPTFPDGFRFLGAAVVRGAKPIITRQDGEKGLGTPLFSEKEGRLSHGVVKRYTPINEATGSAATATIATVPQTLALFLCLCSSQDGPDVVQAVGRELSHAARAGLPQLRRENEALRARSVRRTPARATAEGSSVVAAPTSVLPPLRKRGGYYGDVALCSVDSTKFCFQDAAIWHADFHLNEIRAESMLALGQFEDIRPYCEMIRTMLPQAVENARAVYGLPGAMYPLVAFPLKSRGVAHTSLTWEQDMGLNGLIAKPLWLWYRYTGDRGG